MKTIISFTDKGLLLNGELTKQQSRGIRIVYLNKNYVVKLEQFFNSIKQTQSYNEFKTYQKIKEEDKKHFAEILDYGRIKIFDNTYCYIVQRYIQNSRGKKAAQHKKKVDELGKKYKITDLHNANWHVNNKNIPVIFDIGYSGKLYY